VETAPREFLFSPEPEPHKARTRSILREHPEVRQLIGKNPWTAFWTFLLVGAQFGLMAVAIRIPWWGALLLAYVAGAVIVHSLLVVIHECAHNLVFRRSWANSLLGIFANFPSVIPSSASFQKFHLLHHAFQGVYDRDADIPSHWEARLVRNSAIGKILWLLLFPIVETLRTLRLRDVRFFNRWIFLNLVVMIGVNTAVVAAFGWGALLYLTASAFFAVGLHPLGARWVQRHYLVHGDGQETTSYYGPANYVAFNVGYHNEHHDFPSVPWNRLPEIRRTAPEHYEGLHAHRSWTRLLLRFLFDPSISLHSRVIRTNRGGVREEAPVVSAEALTPGP
jgi:sphingolipid delta-4 desaturase